ncbi:hypothetical protein BT69DRAFT_1330222 [Atractiella rhizophila]|nr:hypothetical protein BT69DRAFT_1330222 [Atractiella rhizophila]
MPAQPPKRKINKQTSPSTPASGTSKLQVSPDGLDNSQLSDRWRVRELLRTRKEGYTSSAELMRDMASLKKGFPGKKFRAHDRGHNQQKRKVSLSRIQQFLAFIFDRDKGPIGFVSVDARLGDYHLAYALSGHLMCLGMRDIVARFKGATTFHFPTTWTSYEILKGSQEPLADYMEIYLAFLLFIGSERSYHSGILGSKALAAVPPQRIQDNLMDLRAQGFSKGSVRFQLGAKCMFLCLADNSPLRRGRDRQTLAIILILLGSLARFQTQASVELLEIGIDIFRELWKTAGGVEERRSLFDEFWDGLWLFDIQLHGFIAQLPVLRAEEIRAILRSSSSGRDPEFMIDPLHLPHCMELTDQGQFLDAAWEHLWCVSREITSTLHVIRQESASQRITENLCYEIFRHLIAFREWRVTNFSYIPFGETSTFHTPVISGPLGGEPAGYSHQIHSTEAKNAFEAASLVRESCSRFPESNLLKNLLAEMEAFCDEQVRLCVDFFEVSYQLYEKGPDDPLVFRDVRLRILLLSAFDVAYLPEWSRRFPGRKKTIQK